MTSKLHFALKPADAESLRASPPLADAPAQHERRACIYHDTPDGELRQRGYVLTTCWLQGRWTQSLRNIHDLAAESSLQEIESDAVDYDRLPEQGRQLRAMLARQTLEPICRIALQRSRWEVALSDSARSAVLLDQGEIKTSSRQEPLCELTLALSAGNARDVYDWALELARHYPLRWLGQTSADCARGALCTETPTHHKAGALILPKDASSEDAFSAIVAACLDHAQHNVEAVRAGQEEGVHQLRVAFRRLRSGLKTFRSLIPREASAALVEELRWLNGFLGPARDWDVFLGEGLAPILNRFPDRRGLQTARRDIIGIQTACYQALQQCLEEARYHRLVLSLRGWLDCRRWRDHLTEAQIEALRQPAVAFATDLLKRQHRRVVRRGAQFAHLSPEERHQLRIKIKELRYAVEFFASLFSGSSAPNYVKAAAGLQDCLGALNDLSVADQLLDQAGLNSRAPVRALIEGWYACKAAVQEQQFNALWETFLACERPWKRHS